MSEPVALSASEIRDAEAENQKLRARDLADKLGISEAQLVAARVGHGTVRIAAHPDEIMAQVAALGDVLALTRNPSAVHERDGLYDNYQSGKHASMVLSPEIDLRIFPQHWVSAFAVELPGEAGPRRSLQVFDAAGDAVHKIHLRDTSNHDLWSVVVQNLALSEQSDALDVAPRVAPSPAQERPDRADELRAEWDKMTDTHQFMILTSRLKMNRLGAYRVAGAPYVRPLATTAVDTLIERLGDTGLPVMIFVGNHGCIQIHSGPVHNIKRMGPWMNVLDPRFNLHLRSDHIAEVYEVRKPTKRGEALSVEAFDKDGAIILQIFGMRSDDADYVADYDALVSALPGLTAEVPA